MFQYGYSAATQYTGQIIFAFRCLDNTVGSGLGSFIALNNDGWLITAAHNMHPALAFNHHKPLIAEYRAKVEHIKGDTTLDQKQKELRISELPHDNKWITDLLLWVGADGAEVLESYVYDEHDIAFLRIDAKFMAPGMKFPKIKNPEKYRPGTSLCKLGFPFHMVNATFNEQLQRFDFPPNLFPIPAFPIEGIYTRNLFQGKCKEGRDIAYLETSSPALKGQSGGPIFDTMGDIYAVVSKNLTLPLGFTGEIEVNNQKVIENQFINVGIGVHGQTIVALLQKHKIKFEMAE